MDAESEVVVREAVNLTRITSRKVTGKAYTYWVLRWHAVNGRQCSKSLGRADVLSRRSAEKLRRQKQAELDFRPQRRNIQVSPKLGEFLEVYFKHRQSELSSGTVTLYRQAARYLTGYFGQDRRLDAILRPDARAFKAALANDELAYLNRKPRRCMAEATVNMNIRSVRKMFAVALEDGLIAFNPFDRIAGRNPPPQGWHEVTCEEFERLLRVANPSWRRLLALTRLACLRRGEALNLLWENIDWQRSRLTVIASGEWKPKDRDSRTVPICPELRVLLLEAFHKAQPGHNWVIPPGEIKVKNLSRDFGVLCRQAGVQRYAKPLHTLRKTGLTDWARRFPAHVVAAWAGHASFETTQQFYLKVGDAEYDRAAGMTPPAVDPQP